jgi:hypothetical protein
MIGLSLAINPSSYAPEMMAKMSGLEKIVK